MNGMWGMVVTAVGIAAILGSIYLIWTIGKFPGIKKITKDSKLLKIVIPTVILAAGFGIFVITMSVINAVIVLIHLMLFRLILGIAGFIINKVRGKENTFYWQGWFSLIACTVYLGIGFFTCHHVFTTVYDLETYKSVGNLKIVMFADSHIGTTFDGEGFMKEVEKINGEKPDLVLISGDFVDDGTTKDDMIKACEALGKINARYGVWFVYGNHDKGYYGGKRGFSASDLERYFMQNKVHVLQDRIYEIGENIVIVGRADASNRGRKSIGELTKDIDDDKYIIVLDHQPQDYENEAASKSDLVLSGHTHGGQFFPLTVFGMPPNDRTYGYEKRNGTDFIVTSGISDWELKFKPGTKSEYVVINLKGK